MPIAINGAGTITGLSAGGLPDDSIITADIANSAVTDGKIVGMASSKLTGAVPTAALSNIEGKGADIASAGTMVIGTDGGYFDITGTTGITAMTVAVGRMFTLQFDGAVVLTNSSTLKLSGAANFTTAAGDHLTFVSVAANDVRQIGFGLTDGGSPVAPAGGVDGITTSANATAITISADEEVTFDKQPHFSGTNAIASNVTGNGTIWASTSTSWTEYIDRGSNFASGSFTAPVGGQYIATMKCDVEGILSGHTRITYNFVTSNRTYPYGWLNAYAVSNLTIMSNAVAHIFDMDASDTVHFTIVVTGAAQVVDINGGGLFSVSLIS